MYLRLCARDAKALRDFVPKFPGAALWYIKAIAAHTVHDYFRKEPKHEFVDFPTDLLVERDGAEWRLRLLDIEKILKQHAKKEERELFRLYYVQGFSAKAIAALVFHGTFLFVRRKDGIEVLLPVVKGHEYLAGTYFKEKPLDEKGVYGLTGVTAAPGFPVFEVKDNLHFGGQLISGYQAKLYCSWSLPHPKEIRGVRQLKVDPDYFTGSDAGEMKNQKEIALVHVFVYEFDDLNSLSVVNTANGGTTPLPWQPASGESPGTVNLRVFAAPAEAMTMTDMSEHVTEAFKAMAGLIEGFELGFHYPPDATPAPRGPAVVPGLPESELLDLAERPDKGVTPAPTTPMSGAPASPEIAAHPADMGVMPAHTAPISGAPASPDMGAHPADMGVGPLHTTPINCAPGSWGPQCTAETPCPQTTQASLRADATEHQRRLNFALWRRSHQGKARQIWRAVPQPRH